MTNPVLQLQPSQSDTIAAPNGSNGRPSVLGRFTLLVADSGKRAFWPLADQGVVSLGNILTILVLGRGLQIADFGTFALILEALFFFVSIHAGLITYPLTVGGAVADPAKLRRLTAAALWLTLFMAVPIAIAGLLVAHFYQMTAIGIVAIGALLAWQLQEVVRRALLSHFRYTLAIWGDGLNYLGQAAILLVLAYLGRLTLLSALTAMGFTSLVALTLQATQVGLGRLERGELLNTAMEFWRRGRWIALTNSSGVCLMLCGNWALGWSHGREEVADYAAVGALLKICNPVLQTVGNLIVPASAKALDRGGLPAARQVALKICAMAGMLIAPVLLLLVVAPNWCLWLAFHGKYKGPGYPEALRCVVVGYVLIYLNTAMTSFLNGVHRSHFTFYGQMAATISMFALLLPLTISFGWVGYAAGGVLPVLVQLLVLFWLVRKVR